MELKARPIRPDEAEAFRTLVDEPAIAHNTGSIPAHPDLDWAKARIAERQQGEARIGARMERGIYHGDTLVGIACLFPSKDGEQEIGYAVGADWRGRGVATFAAQAAIDLARSLGHDGPLVAAYAQDNPASGRVLQKLGFVDIGPGTFESLGRGGTVITWRMRLEP